MKNLHTSLAQEHVYGTLRTLLISYGVIAFGYLTSRSTPTDEPTVPGFAATAQGFVALGLGAQLLLIVARWLIRRRLSDPAAIAQVSMALEIIGDGVTVLLFALATLGPILHIPDSL